MVKLPKSKLPEKGFGYIYRYTFDDGKMYYGQTVKTVGERHKAHISGNLVVDRVIREMMDAEIPFKLEIVEKVPLNLLNNREEYYIARDNTQYPNGWNFTKGGDSFAFNEEIRKKKSESQKGEKHWRFGQNIIRCVETGVVYDTLTQASIETNILVEDLSKVVRGLRYSTNGLHFEYVDDEKRAEAEAIRAKLDAEKQERLKQYYEQNHDIMVEKGKKLAESNIGRKYTPEHCENISKSLTGRKLSPEHVAKMKGHSGFEGKHHTEEEKKRRSEAMKGKNNPFYGKKGADAVQSKPVIAYAYPSMEVIGEFVNQKQASEHFEVLFQAVSACCRGTIKSTKQKTLTFRFKDTNNV